MPDLKSKISPKISGKKWSILKHLEITKKRRLRMSLSSHSSAISIGIFPMKGFGFSDKVKVSSTKQFKNDWDKLIKINVDQPINLEVERI